MIEEKRLVPEVGLEPTWALSPLDFESSAYTNFATPARTLDNKTLDRSRQDGAEYFIVSAPFSAK